MSENVEQKLDPTGSVVMPAMQIPSFRTSLALQNKTEKNLLLRTWGGIGDQICAEPTLRFALKSFGADCKISLVTEYLELFAHLKFNDVFHITRQKPKYEDYFVFDTIVPATNNLTWEFFSHCITNCVDFASLCAFRCQLPVRDREIFLCPPTPNDTVKEFLTIENTVFVHPGKHWPSKTFPKDWWDGVLAALLNKNLKPILIGANTDDNRGTVDVNADGCIDLRNKLSLEESIWLLQRSKVLLTNDSSPLHMAASRDPNDGATGRNWIGYIATCKHPDYISHWRQGEWNYREENLGLGGIWNDLDHLPNKKTEVTVEHVEEARLRSWLPSPDGVSDWVIKRMV